MTIMTGLDLLAVFALAVLAAGVARHVVYAFRLRRIGPEQLKRTARQPADPLRVRAPVERPQPAPAKAGDEVPF